MVRTMSGDACSANTDGHEICLASLLCGAVGALVVCIRVDIMKDEAKKLAPAMSAVGTVKVWPRDDGPDDRLALATLGTPLGLHRVRSLCEVMQT